ncbi:MAG TPA: hypothetical protein DCP54_00660 [Chryseobacterium sp.]|nr:hypothetical protein [Chryseobacterium sp.]
MILFKRFLILTIFLLSEFIYSQAKFLPIIAFQGVPETNNTEKDFSNLKKAGFNVNLNMYSNMGTVKKALDLCQKYGIKLIFSVPDIKTNPEVILSVKDHPALLGYYIEDEPNASRFDDLKRIVDKFKTIDGKHTTYINLYPNYASPEQMLAPDYTNYVHKFLSKVDVDILSFDHYPIANNEIRSRYYDNLEVIRGEALKFKKPFWAFACSVIHFDYLEPLLGGIKLQQFSNLLYGAKGIQYYTYWNVNDNYWKQNKYGYAVADGNGPTPTYKLVKEVNKQISKLSWFFTNSIVDHIYHLGETIPENTKRLVFLPEKFKMFESYGKPALVSFMSIAKKHYIVIQNKNIFESLAFNFETSSGVDIIDRNTGKTKSVSSKAQIENIPPGDILIFAYK